MMRRAILLISILAATALLLAFGWGGDISSSDLEAYFRKYTVDGNYPVAIKKRSLGGVGYLATVHGYPTNLSVCEELIAPYNKEQSRSVIPGEYFCEELR